MEQLYRVEQVAELMQLGRTRIYEMIARGELRSIRVGSARRIPESALAEWLDRVSEESDGSDLGPKVAASVRWAKAGPRS